MRTKDIGSIIEQRGTTRFKFDTEQEAKQAQLLAIGRLFRLVSDPVFKGISKEQLDTEFNNIHDVVLEASEYLEGVEVEKFVSRENKQITLEQWLQQS